MAPTRAKLITRYRQVMHRALQKLHNSSLPADLPLLGGTSKHPKKKGGTTKAKKEDHHKGLTIPAKWQEWGRCKEAPDYCLQLCLETENCKEVKALPTLSASEITAIGKEQCKGLTGKPFNDCLNKARVTEIIKKTGNNSRNTWLVALAGGLLLLLLAVFLVYFFCCRKSTTGQSKNTGKGGGGGGGKSGRAGGGGKSTKKSTKTKSRKSKKSGKSKSTGKTAGKSKGGGSKKKRITITISMAKGKQQQ